MDSFGKSEWADGLVDLGFVGVGKSVGSSWIVSGCLGDRASGVLGWGGRRDLRRRLWS